MHRLFRFGLIGLGFHAKSLLESFARAKLCSLSAVASRHTENAKFLEKKYPGIRFHTDYDRLLSDPEINAVLIASENFLHFELASMALALGKHVLCEKPIALTADEATRLATISQKHGRALGETFYYRRHPQHETLRTLLAEGRIGPPQEIDVEYHYELADRSNFRLSRERGGGILFDAGCYGVDFSRLIFGAEPVSASGQFQFDPTTGVDIAVKYQLEFPEARFARVSCSMTSPRKNSCTVRGANKNSGREKASFLHLQNAFHVKPGQKVSVLLQNAEKRVEFHEQPFDQYAAFLDRWTESVLANGGNGEGIENGERNTRALQRLLDLRDAARAG